MLIVTGIMERWNVGMIAFDSNGFFGFHPIFPSFQYSTIAFM
jgi:hypothetical protein